MLKYWIIIAAIIFNDVKLGDAFKIGLQWALRPAATTTSLYLAKQNKAGDDALTRRRNRRKDGGNATPSISNDEGKMNVESANAPNQDGSSSLEDMFGLGNDQLRELMEQELPVPREDLSTRKEVNVDGGDKNKVFRLPDLEGFMQDGEYKEEKRNKNEKSNQDEKPRVDRSNQEEYLRVLQLNPFADADETMFLDEYDIIPSIFGSGKLLNIPVPYLQTGHGILLAVTLLAALVYAPGNPLTEFPVEIRTFFKQGLQVTYSINAVLAVQAYFKAKSKNLPAVFWAIKCFLLGGVAFFEIGEARDPKLINAPKEYSSTTDRKAKRRNKQ